MGALHDLECSWACVTALLLWLTVVNRVDDSNDDSIVSGLGTAWTRASARAGGK